MKRLAIILLTLVAVLVMAAPAQAASLGISPPRVELEVPADGSATVDFQIYYFSGDVKISLVNIPLKVTPDIITVNALADPENIQLTIYGDPSLGSLIYDGYIRFLGIGGDTVAVAVQAKAKITNLVAGQEPVPAPPPATATSAAPATSPAVQNQAQNTSPGGVNIQPSPEDTNSPDTFAGLSLNMVILIAGGLVFLGLIILAVSLGRRRRF
jgi:hypothetical protein